MILTRNNRPLVCGVWLAVFLGLAGCDQSPAPTAAQKPRVDFEDVRGISSGKQTSEELDEILDAAAQDEARRNIVSAGYRCDKPIELWFMKSTSGKEINVYKAICPDGVEYQVTLDGNKSFVKLWTGVLIGDP